MKVAYAIWRFSNTASEDDHILPKKKEINAMIDTLPKLSIPQTPE